MPDPNELTKNQRRVFTYLKKQIEEKSHVPTIREIGNHFGIASPNGVAGLLNRIEAKGMIKRTRNRARSIMLTEKSSTSGLPLIGNVLAGPMEETFAQAERFEFEPLKLSLIHI